MVCACVKREKKCKQGNPGCLLDANAYVAKNNLEAPCKEIITSNWRSFKICCGCLSMCNASVPTQLRGIHFLIWLISAAGYV